MKKIFILAFILVIGYYFYYNKYSQCETLEDVKDKGLELTQAFIHAVSSKDKDIDTTGIIAKIKQIDIMKKDNIVDIQMACEVMDDIMAELE